MTNHRTVSNFLRKFKTALQNPTRAKGYFIRSVEDTYLRYIDSTIRDYEKNLQIKRGHALVTYIPEAFHYTRFSPRFYSSSNRWQSIEIANVLNSLGYSVDMVHLESTDFNPNVSKYDILFGQGSNFRNFGEIMSEEVLKIYYATSEHSTAWKHSEARRFRDLKDRRGVQLTPEREFSNKDTVAIADAIVSIGSSTISSYKSILGNQIPAHSIKISTYPGVSDFSNIPEKNFEEAKSNYLFFAGSGAVLKGLDIALEVFKKFDNIHLYVCGPMRQNNEFVSLYEGELCDSDNIHFVGWTDITSKKFKQIVRTSAFHIYPTASDAGTPSSLATTMRAGLIPIAPSNVVDITRNYGIDITDCNIENLEEVVRTASGAPASAVKDTAIDSYLYANTAFTRERYTQDLTHSINEILHESPKIQDSKIDWQKYGQVHTQTARNI